MFSTFASYMSPTGPNTISSTARYMALFRALETARGKDRLFEDGFAIRFLPVAWRAVLNGARTFKVLHLLERAIDKRGTGAWSSGVARTRLIDDWIDEAVILGAQQVVLLGTGFDCRALRLPSLAKISTFELDRLQLLEEKRKRLGDSVVAAHPHLHYVPVDFLQDDVGARLSASGFVRGMRTLVLWEGVTNYLDADAVASGFDFVAKICAPGSRIIFTYVHAGVLDGGFEAPGLHALFTRLAASNENWTFGFRPEQLVEYLRRHGLNLLEDLGAAEYRVKVMGARARGLVGYEFYHVAVAEVGDATVPTGA
jgi:methyltransferase (TIGR00027 family)